MFYCDLLKMNISIDTFIISNRTRSSEKCSSDNFYPSHLAKVKRKQCKLFLCLFKCCLFILKFIEFTSYCFPALVIFYN